MALPTISSGTYVAQYDASTLGLSDGTAVSSWTDGTGNGNTATQATGANQPLCKTNILNGLSVVRFDGSNDFMDSAAINVSQPTTIFVVAQSSVASGAGHNLVDGTTARQAVYQHSSGVVAMYAGTAESLTGIAWGTTAFHYITSVFNGASSTIRIDGTGQTLTPGDPGNAALTGLRFGAFDAATAQWQGDLAELIICSGGLNSTDQGAVEAYIVSKWFSQQFIHPFNAIPFMSGH